LIVVEGGDRADDALQRRVAGVVRGDPDPINAGTAGDSAPRGGSSAGVENTANPF
jgi:hypothetical protein